MWFSWFLLGMIAGLLIGGTIAAISCRRYYERFIKETKTYHDEELDHMIQSTQHDTERELSDDIGFILENYNRHFQDCEDLNSQGSQGL